MRLNQYMRYLLWGLLVALVLYGIYGLVYIGREDRALKDENEYLQEHYDNLLERNLLVDDVIKGLQARDNQIYHNIFNVDPPTAEGLTGGGDEEELEQYLRRMRSSS